MKINTRGLYAVMALVDLALRVEEPLVALPDVAARQGISLAYLEQIFRTLRQKGFVTSVRGQKGGYVLGKPPQDIPVSAIIAAMGEAPHVTRCNREKDQDRGCLPNGAQCLTHHMWVQLEAHIEAYLSRVSLADICARALPIPERVLERRQVACL